jgi:predicted 3-demethylubiquinone-9 3-methyltransferase (glyoxalase superfamily)
MDSAQKHDFAFNEAISLIVNCDSQDEIDRYWSALSAAPEAEQCGWLKDKFGLSWQITPGDLEEMLRSSSEAQVDRVTQAFLPMKKLDIETLRRAYEGR